MKKNLALAGLTLGLLPLTVLGAQAKPTHKPMHRMAAQTMTPAAMYECSKCHMKFTAAQAKKDHYRDPMDGGKLVPVKAAAKPVGKKLPKGAISM